MEDIPAVDLRGNLLGMQLIPSPLFTWIEQPSVIINS